MVLKLNHTVHNFLKRNKVVLLYRTIIYAKKTVFYNDEMPEGRIRFSLMHELGHHVLKHEESRTEQHENEANYFASHIIVPRMAIHYAKCKNLNDVSKLFQLTYEAADYVIQDYRRWHRHVTYHKRMKLMN